MSALRKRVLTTRQDIGDADQAQVQEDYDFLRSGYNEPKPLSGSEIMAKNIQKEADAEQSQHTTSVPSTPATKEESVKTKEPQQDAKKEEPEMTVKDL